MRRALLFVSAVALAATATSPAQAAIYVFTGTFSGLNEVPPNASPGTGTAVVTFDDVAHTLAIDVSFSGLIGTTTAAHIHNAPPGVNGPVATTTPSFVGFPLGVTAGNYVTTLDMTQAGTFNGSFITFPGGGTVAGAEAALFAALAGGNAYFNIHTTQFPGGEIRANLAAVPEPATWAMLIGGLMATGAALRRRRSARTRCSNAIA